MLLAGSWTYDSDPLFHKKKPLKQDDKLLTKLITFSLEYFIPLLGSNFVSTPEPP